MKKIIYLLICSIVIVLSVSANSNSFTPIEVWRDTNGNQINAHGGGVLYHEGTYYWVGEHKSEKSAQAKLGVRMYSSKDLYNWKDEGIVMSVAPKGSNSVIESGCIIERPKVIYNAETKKFVLWFHLEIKGAGYNAALYGVAQSDSVTGPYKFLYADRSCAWTWPINMDADERREAMKLKDLERHTPEGEAALVKGGWVAKDFATGQMSRDQTVFVDDDGKAYHIFSSEDNATFHVAELSDDYLYHTGKWARIQPGRSNEAPAIFKRNGRYWMIASGCTGWAPNKARLMYADSIWGPWTALKNPCRGEGADETFGGQSTYILPVEGSDEFIFMADQWRPKDLSDSRYIWLPISFDSEGVPFVEWQSEWKLKK